MTTAVLTRDPDRIVRAVCERFRIARADLCSRSRINLHVVAREVAFHLLRRADWSHVRAVEALGMPRTAHASSCEATSRFFMNKDVTLKFAAEPETTRQKIADELWSKLQAGYIPPDPPATQEPRESDDLRVKCCICDGAGYAHPAAIRERIRRAAKTT